MSDVAYIVLSNYLQLHRNILNHNVCRISIVFLAELHHQHVRGPNTDSRRHGAETDRVCGHPRRRCDTRLRRNVERHQTGELHPAKRQLRHSSTHVRRRRFPVKLSARAGWMLSHVVIGGNVISEMHNRLLFRSV